MAFKVKRQHCRDEAKDQTLHADVVLSSLTTQQQLYEELVKLMTPDQADAMPATLSEFVEAMEFSEQVATNTDETATEPEHTHGRKRGRVQQAAIQAAATAPARKTRKKRCGECEACLNAKTGKKGCLRNKAERALEMQQEVEAEFAALEQLATE